MQFKKNLSLIIIPVFLFCFFSTHAQVLTTNESGEEIVVYSDGSWAYYDNLDAEEKNAIKGKSSKKTKKKKKKKAKKKKSKKKKSSKKKDNKKEVAKRAKKSKKNKKSPVTTTPDYSEQEELMARREAIQRAEWAAMEEARTKNILDQEIEKQSLLRQKLSGAYSNTKISVTQLDQFQKDFKNQQAVVKNATASHEEAEDYLELTESMIDMKKGNRDGLLAKLEQKQDNQSASWSDDLTEENTGVANSSRKSKKSKKSKKNNKQQNPATLVNQDLIAQPPVPPCALAFDDVDEFTGKRRWEMPKEVFFTHTSDRLRPFFKEKSHITVEGFLSGTSGGSFYLNLTMTVLSEFAQREFGVLEKGSVVSLKLINGNNIKLFNTKTSTGTLNKVEKSVVYQGQYLLQSDEMKSLKKSEVDKVRIVWGTGYEDYENYHLDFLIDQINCLEQNK